MSGPNLVEMEQIRSNMKKQYRRLNVLDNLHELFMKRGLPEYIRSDRDLNLQQKQ